MPFEQNYASRIIYNKSDYFDYDRLKKLIYRLEREANRQHWLHDASWLPTFLRSNKVEDEDDLALLLRETVGQCRCLWLAEQLDLLETSQAGRPFGGFALGRHEVGRHGDDGAGDFLARVGLCALN